MKLWVGRHGFAGNYSTDPQKERERPLQDMGATIAQAVAKKMLRANEVPNVIFTSPYARAQQTADIYGKAFGVRVSPLDDLGPDRPLEDRILELISGGDGALKRVMILGHVDNTTPAFENLGGDFDPLVMGEVRRLRIDRKSGQWKERWRLRPSDLGFQDYGKGQ